MPCSDAAGTCSEACPHLAHDYHEAKLGDIAPARITSVGKRALRAQRREEKRAVKKWKRDEKRTNGIRWGLTPQERQQFACFWTWPFGHVYEKTPIKTAKVCMACGYEKRTGSYGGGY